MKKEKINNVVFFNGFKDIRAGGPCGYIANLEKAIKEYYDTKEIIFITQESIISSSFDISPFYEFIAKWSTIFIFSKKHRKSLRQKLYNLLKFGLNNLSNPNIFTKEYSRFVPLLDAYDFKTIICHSTRDAIFISNYLKNRKSSAKLLIMSHSPEPPSTERYHDEKLCNNPNAEKNYIIWQKIEKRAFEKADIFVFPTKEAMEPYINSLSYFSNLINQKEVKYVVTGCEQIDTNTLSEDFRIKYNIQTPYIISYIGRHTAIKGYDILKEIADEVLKNRDDVTFVIGGVKTNEFSPLDSPRWIELGKISPADLLKISDIFILPNRQTYFDLILLEVLSTGVYTIASNTGGNKSVYSMTQAIDLYNTKEECIKYIYEFLDSSGQNKNSKKEKCLKAYLENYTLKHFAQNYIAMITDITR